ncbi:MAG: M20/M25/M40 family metallo-hydrolase [Clostridiaceae bacterium]|nr:M20/M25/M40 family metallo-hydrolase [Clostridiaceae bacterium]
MDFRETIARLSAPPGVSGYEQCVAACAAELLTPYCDTVETLPLYSVAGTRYAKLPGAPKVLLDAHIDQIGFIVTGYAGEGFVRFTTCGGFDPRVLPAKEVLVHTKEETLHGVVACLPPHLRDAEKSADAAATIDDLVVDLGMSRADAEAKVPIGTPITVAAPPFALANDFIGAAALDDRACFTAILYALELLKGETLAVDLTVVGSSREETSGAGAATAAYRIRPDYAVAVDVTHAWTPDAPKERTFPAGVGACIGVGPHLNRKVSSTLVRLAKDKGIPYTPEILPGNTGTNASPMQVVRTGVATGLVSLPLRYMHTACEVIRESDAKACGELLAAFVRSFNEGVPRC